MLYLAKELQKKRCACGGVCAQRHDLLPVTFTPASEHNPVPLESSAEGGSGDECGGVQGAWDTGGDHDG